MEIRILLTFIEVANLKNFTQASKVLGYSQSNISAQIRQLENELGVTLFERMSRGVRLTQYGHELLPLARDIVALSTQMGRFSQTEAEMEGVLRVGVVESIFNFCFESLIVNYAKRFPRIKLELTVDGTMAIEELVLKNQLDVVCTINELLPKTKWNCYYKQKVEILIVAGKNHPLASKEFITPEDISREKCIMMEDTSPYVAHFYHYFAMKGVVLEPFLSLQSSQMASKLIQKGDYISFLPEYTVRNLIQEDKLCVLKLREYEQWQNIQLISHLNKVETRPLLGFLEEAKRVLKTMEEKCKNNYFPVDK